MRRHLVALLALGLVVGALAPAQAAKKKPKPKPKPPVPVAVDVTYNVVWNGDACALSIATTLADAAQACQDPFAGVPAATGVPAAAGESTGPYVISAIDGLPLTLDAAKPIKGKIQMDSYVLADEAPAPMGVGLSEVVVTLTGTSAGAEVAIGEATAEYQVTPASTDYEFEFEIKPGADLANKVLDELTMTVEVAGNTAFHGVIPADATSTLTLGAFALPQ